MKQISLLLFFIITICNTYAQNERVEKFLNANKQLPDSLIIKYTLDSAYNLKFSDFETSIQFAKIGIEYSKKNKDNINEANGYNVIGICNHLQNNYQEAFNFYQKALEIFIKNKLYRGQASSLINLAALYNDQKNQELAINYNKKALKIAIANKDTINISAVYNNIGICYQNLNKLDSALYFYYKSLDVRKSLNRLDLLVNSYSTISTAYSDKKEYEKALEYQLKVLDYESQNNNKRGYIISLSNISSNYFSLKQYDKAVDNAKKALELANEIHFIQMLPDIYFNLFTIYNNLNDSRNTAKYAIEYIKLKDSLSIVEANEKLIEVQTKYDTKLKENEILMLNTQNEVKNQKIEQQKNVTYFLVVFAVLSVVIIIIAYRAYRLKTKTNQMILTQNNTLTLQKEEIEQKNLLVEEKSKLLQHALGEIKDSINYAKRIQEAILPKTGKMTEFEQLFSVLYLPKDVVSGDFYWFERVDNKYIFAAADCTGHGVPGAFMSMIGVNNLNQIIIENKITQPNLILKELNRAVKKVLKQEGMEGEVKDGMDISVLCFDIENQKVQYSGAFRPLFFIRDNKLEEVKGSRNPIGGNAPSDFEYELHEIDYKTNDSFYMCSDGFADQFGGDKGKKFMNKHLKDSFLEIHNERPQKQVVLLKEILENWKGSIDQIDDVLVMCFKV